MSNPIQKSPKRSTGNRLLDREQKRKLQLLLLNDERFVRNFFSGLEELSLERVSPQKRNKQKNQEKHITLPIEEVVTKLVKAHVKTTEDIYDTIWSQDVILGTIALNCIELRNDIRELARAFNTPQKKREEKLIQIAHRFEVEEKEFQEAIKSAKQIARLTRWWDRRLEDMKRGNPYERI